MNCFVKFWFSYRCCCFLHACYMPYGSHPSSLINSCLLDQNSLLNFVFAVRFKSLSHQLPLT